MSATCVRQSRFLVESESASARQTELTPAADLRACMVQLGLMIASGRKVHGVRHRGKQVGRPVLEAMMRLASYRRILDRLANSFGLEVIEVSGTFGHLLIEDAFLIQDFLEAAATDPVRRIQSRTRAAPDFAGSSVPRKSFRIQPTPTPDSALMLEELSPGQPAARGHGLAPE